MTVSTVHENEIDATSAGHPSVEASVLHLPPPRYCGGEGSGERDTRPSSGPAASNCAAGDHPATSPPDEHVAHVVAAGLAQWGQSFLRRRRWREDRYGLALMLSLALHVIVLAGSWRWMSRILAPPRVELLAGAGSVDGGVASGGSGLGFQDPAAALPGDAAAGAADRAMPAAPEPEAFGLPAPQGQQPHVADARQLLGQTTAPPLLGVGASGVDMTAEFAHSAPPMPVRAAEGQGGGAPATTVPAPVASGPIGHAGMNGTPGGSGTGGGLAASGVIGGAPRASSRNKPPEYPTEARRRGYEGTVLLAIDVLADGSVAGVRIVESSGHDVLDQAAVESVRKWQFTPAQTELGPVRVEVTVPIQFVLHGR